MPATRAVLAIVLAAATLGLTWAAAARHDGAAAAPRLEGPSGETAPGEPAAGAVAPGATAVVELFTSQGCSSCPPADRLLSELAVDPAYAGRVFPLAFHVDYWNYIGWRDPFSSDRWSARQRRYARELGSTVYTPQAVVNGRWETVGSRRGDLGDLVAAALAEPPAAEVALHVEPVPGGVAVETAVRRASGGSGGAADLWLALYQDGLETAVERGENADRELHNDRVVRRLERAARLSAGEREAAGKVELAIEPEWPAEGLGVVGFAQDPETLAILGAASARVGDGAAAR